MDLVVKNPHLAEWGGRLFRCAIGSGGIISEKAKREGDKATPEGRWRMREVLYRADRGIGMPATRLPLRAIDIDDGWCEVPENINYNRLVKCPYAVPVDPLWREDNLYDIVVVLDYNYEPVIPGKGSAIFLHIARPNFSPSIGCVALQKDDLLTVLYEAGEESAVVVMPQSL